MVNIKHYPIDYSKIPDWAKGNLDTRKLCKDGKHVPVVSYSNDGEITETFCQNCAKTMIIDDWLKFFGYK